MSIALRARKLPYDAQAARRHLRRADETMAEIVRRVGPLALEIRGAPYQSLLRAVLYQQLAGAAASAIERRFLGLYGGRVPEPEELIATSPDALRAAGLSRQKAGYLRSIAEHASAGGLELRRLRRMDDEELIATVTAIKGIGRWTADMLLMFCLGRPDVLPVGDLGVQRTMQAAYGLRAPPDAKRMERIAEPWRPYRSAGTWYLWRYGDVITPDATL